MKRKKLTLGKITIANLNNSELANIYGGETTACGTIEFSDCKYCWIETETTGGSWLPCITVDDCGHTGEVTCQGTW